MDRSEANGAGSSAVAGVDAMAKYVDSAPGRATDTPSLPASAAWVQRWREARTASDGFVADLIHEHHHVHEQLRSFQKAYAELEGQHAQLQQRYDTDKENWRQFNTWWVQSLERKRQAKAATPAASSPAAAVAVGAAGDETPPQSRVEDRIARNEQIHLSATPAANTFRLRTASHLRLTTADEAVLRRVGLPSAVSSKGIKGETKDALHGLPSPISPSLNPDGETVLFPHKQRAAGASIPMQAGRGATHRASPLQDSTNFGKNKGETKSSPDAPSALQRRASMHASPDKEIRSTSSLKRPRKSINAEYEIDPAKNNDRNYLHKDVVRSKVKRKQMHALDCECCREYYERVGPIAVRPFEEIREPSEDEKDSRVAVKDSEGDEAAARQQQKHKQLTSRHRDFGPPPLTPPGYWDIDFPTTQKLGELNKQAEEAHEKQRQRVARDPRFRRRENANGS